MSFNAESTGAPPAVAPLDLLGLRGEPLATLIDAFVKVIDEEPHPARIADLSALAQLVTDEVVHLVRAGEAESVGAAAGDLQRFLVGEGGEALATVAPGVADQLHGVLPVLTAAAVPSSRDGAAMLLRSWGERPRQIFERVARAGRVRRADLKVELGLSETHLSHLLAALEEGRIVERIRTEGSRLVDVVLGRAGLDLATELGISPSSPAGSGGRTLRPGPSVDQSPRWDELNHRLDDDDLIRLLVPQDLSGAS